MLPDCKYVEETTKTEKGQVIPYFRCTSYQVGLNENEPFCDVCKRKEVENTIKKMTQVNSLKTLTSFLEYRKELCENDLKTCEEALKTLKHPKHIEYWKIERDSLKNQIEDIKKRMEVYQKSTS